MKRIFPFGLLLMMTTSASSIELKPSMGITYNRLDLSQQAEDPGNSIQGLTIDSVILDLDVPMSESWGIKLAGGPTVATTQTWDRTFSASTILIDSFGNVIGLMGKNKASLLTQTLKGYNISASLRWRFN